MKFRTIALASASVLLGACAPMISGSMNMGMTQEKAVSETARYFGTTPDKILISNYDKGALSTSYQVRYSGTLYNCTIYYGEVKCTKPGA